MSKEWTKDELIEALVNFKEALNFIRQNKQVWFDTVGDCDKAFCDIRHQIENKYPKDYKNRTKAVKLIYAYSIQRRKNKDLLAIFGNLANALDTQTINNLVYTINEAKKQYDNTVNERHYRNRILEDLW